MSSEKCHCAGCEHEVVLRVYPVWKRRLVYQATYCEQHARVFFANYDAAPLASEGPPLRCGATVGFDIELVLCQDRPGHPSQFSLREIGGRRRLDCQTGLFEAVALQRVLERLQFPRPLTHHAIVSVITALGGRLERVEVEKYSPELRVFEAKLHIQRHEVEVLVDVRVSDAVILAVICDVPIFVHDDVLMAVLGTH